jgi:hypothetical protein
MNTNTENENKNKSVGISSLIQKLWAKILDQWVIAGILGLLALVGTIFYAAGKNAIEYQLNGLIEAAIVHDLTDETSELHKRFTAFVSQEIQGTIGASTKQYFELGAEHQTYFVPTYIPKDHSVVLFVDFLKVPNFDEPSEILMSIEGVDAKTISTNEPHSFAPDDAIKRARILHDKAPEDAFAPPKRMMGLLDKIRPDVFTVQFQLRPEDLQKRIAVKLIVFVVNPIWVENEPKM